MHRILYLSSNKVSRIKFKKTIISFIFAFLFLSESPKRYGDLYNSSLDKFLTLLSKQEGIVWTSAFGCKCRTDDALRYIKIIQESNHSNPNIQFAYGDTRHYKAMQDFWRSRHLENMLSSGFYFISSALMLCDELHVYGFWPFKYVTTTNDGTVISAPKSFPYHYYDTVGWKGVHNMPREFKYLVGLHELGALQLHIGKCGE